MSIASPLEVDEVLDARLNVSLAQATCLISKCKKL
jgi:hypothetical protein